MLRFLNDSYDVPLVGSFLISSAVKFFFNAKPPPLDAFWKSSIFAVAAGGSLHFFREAVGDANATSCLVFCAILFWKLQGCLWTAANSLAIYVAVGSGDWGTADSSSSSSSSPPLRGFPIRYVLAPYVSGHLILYVCALGTSVVRRRVRATLIRNEFFASVSRGAAAADDDDAKLRTVFDQIDVNGNGRLDAFELCVSLRAALGADIRLEDCELILKSVDTDGDGTVDYNEFRAAAEIASLS